MDHKTNIIVERYVECDLTVHTTKLVISRSIVISCKHSFFRFKGKKIKLKKKESDEL